ncbi:MAG: rRNA pseudouridine synthase [Betaproteobacteria bacterium]|nr:rRNA pseudouridine synthase [Betaproteobacteria bacterium]
MSDQGKDNPDDPWARWRKPTDAAAGGADKAEKAVVLTKPAVHNKVPEAKPDAPLGTLSVRKRAPVAKPKPEGRSGGRLASESKGTAGRSKPQPGGKTAYPAKATPARDGGKAPVRPDERRQENPWAKAVERKPAVRPTARPAAEDPWLSHRAEPIGMPNVSEVPKGPQSAGVRLSKVMSERGLCSRREADLWIERGWVFVNGEPISELGSRIDPSAEISISKEARKDQAKQVTILLHKPVGYVSGQPEPGCIPAVTLVTPEAQVVQSGDPEFKPWMLRGLAPAGRLDVDSTGLLVLTSDGRVAKKLIGETSDAEKEYLVRVSGEMIKGGLDLLRHGLELDGKPLKQAWVKQLNEDQLHFILKEGKKRQIRRMCELVGLKVVGLKRVRIGRIRLGDLPLGQWRFLRNDEAF